MGSIVLAGDEWGNRGGGKEFSDESMELVRKLAKIYEVPEDLALGVMTEETTLGKYRSNNPLQLSPDDSPRWAEAQRRIKRDKGNEALHYATQSLDRLLEGLEKFEGDTYKASMWYHRPGDMRKGEWDPTYADSVKGYQEALVGSEMVEKGEWLPFSPEAQSFRKKAKLSRTDLVDFYRGKKEGLDSLSY